MADVAKGTVLNKGTQAIGGVTSIGGPSLSRDAIESTDLDDAVRTFIAGLIDSGEVTAELEYEPDDAQHDTLADDLVAGTADTYHIDFADAGSTRYSVSSLVTAYEPSAPLGERLGCSVTLKNTGAITITTHA